MIKAKIAPDLVTYSTVMKSSARAGDLLRTKLWMARMMETGLKADANAGCSIHEFNVHTAATFDGF